MTLQPSQLNDKTILITGAAGMLGRAFVEGLQAYTPARVLALSHTELDVSDADAVKALAGEGIDLIIHCAAYVNAEGCEEDPERCRRSQMIGSDNIATLAAFTGAQVMYPQSFLIYDGTELPITEDTTPNPKSEYARCKLAGENAVVAQVPDALIVRMAGFFGGDDADKNFVGKFVPHVHKLLSEGTTSYAVGDRVWQPTYTIDLARNTLALLDQGKTGVYMMACEGEASFYELAVACVDALGLSDRFTVEKVTATEVAGSEKAFRPDYAAIEPKRLNDEGLNLQRPWREALVDYLTRPYFREMFADLANH